MLKRYLPLVMVGVALLTTIIVTLAVTMATHRLTPTRSVLPFLKGEPDEPTEAIELKDPIEEAKP